MEFDDAPPDVTITSAAALDKDDDDGDAFELPASDSPVKCRRSADGSREHATPAKSVESELVHAAVGAFQELVIRSTSAPTTPGDAHPPHSRMVFWRQSDAPASPRTLADSLGSPTGTTATGGRSGWTPDVFSEHALATLALGRDDRETVGMPMGSMVLYEIPAGVASEETPGSPEWHRIVHGHMCTAMFEAFGCSPLPFGRALTTTGLSTLQVGHTHLCAQVDPKAYHAIREAHRAWHGALHRQYSPPGCEALRVAVGERCSMEDARVYVESLLRLSGGGQLRLGMQYPLYCFAVVPRARLAERLPSDDTIQQRLSNAQMHLRTLGSPWTTQHLEPMTYAQAVQVAEVLVADVLDMRSTKTPPCLVLWSSAFEDARTRERLVLPDARLRGLVKAYASTTDHRHRRHTTVQPRELVPSVGATIGEDHTLLLLDVLPALKTGTCGPPASVCVEADTRELVVRYSTGPTSALLATAALQQMLRTVSAQFPLKPQFVGSIAEAYKKYERDARAIAQYFRIAVESVFGDGFDPVVGDADVDLEGSAPGASGAAGETFEEGVVRVERARPAFKPLQSPDLTDQTLRGADTTEALCAYAERAPIRSEAIHSCIPLTNLFEVLAHLPVEAKSRTVVVHGTRPDAWAAASALAPHLIHDVIYVDYSADAKLQVLNVTSTSTRLSHVLALCLAHLPETPAIRALRRAMSFFHRDEASEPHLMRLRAAVSTFLTECHTTLSAAGANGEADGADGTDGTDGGTVSSEALRTMLQRLQQAGIECTERGGLTPAGQEHIAALEADLAKISEVLVTFNPTPLLWDTGSTERVTYPAKDHRGIATTIDLNTDFNLDPRRLRPPRIHARLTLGLLAPGLVVAFVPPGCRELDALQQADVEEFVEPTPYPDTVYLYLGKYAQLLNAAAASGAAAGAGEEDLAPGENPDNVLGGAVQIMEQLYHQRLMAQARQTPAERAKAEAREADASKPEQRTRIRDAVLQPTWNHCNKVLQHIGYITRTLEQLKHAFMNYHNQRSRSEAADKEAAERTRLQIARIVEGIHNSGDTRHPHLLVQTARDLRAFLDNTSGPGAPEFNLEDETFTRRCEDLDDMLALDPTTGAFALEALRLKVPEKDNQCIDMRHNGKDQDSFWISFKKAQNVVRTFTDIVQRVQAHASMMLSAFNHADKQAEAERVRHRVAQRALRRHHSQEITASTSIVLVAPQADAPFVAILLALWIHLFRPGHPTFGTPRYAPAPGPGRVRWMDRQTQTLLTTDALLRTPSALRIVIERLPCAPGSTPVSVFNALHTWGLPPGTSAEETRHNLFYRAYAFVEAYTEHLRHQHSQLVAKSTEVNVQRQQDIVDLAHTFHNAVKTPTHVRHRVDMHKKMLDFLADLNDLVKEGYTDVDAVMAVIMSNTEIVEQLRGKRVSADATGAAGAYADDDDDDGDDVALVSPMGGAGGAGGHGSPPLLSEDPTEGPIDDTQGIVLVVPAALLSQSSSSSSAKTQPRGLATWGFGAIVNQDRHVHVYLGERPSMTLTRGWHVSVYTKAPEAAVLAAATAVSVVTHPVLKLPVRLVLTGPVATDVETVRPGNVHAAHLDATLPSSVMRGVLAADAPPGLLSTMALCAARLAEGLDIHTNTVEDAITMVATTLAPDRDSVPQSQRYSEVRANLFMLLQQCTASTHLIADAAIRAAGLGDATTYSTPVTLQGLVGAIGDVAPRFIETLRAYEQVLKQLADRAWQDAMHGRAFTHRQQLAVQAAGFYNVRTGDTCRLDPRLEGEALHTFRLSHEIQHGSVPTLCLWQWGDAELAQVVALYLFLTMVPGTLQVPGTRVGVECSLWLPAPITTHETFQMGPPQVERWVERPALVRDLVASIAASDTAALAQPGVPNTIATFLAHMKASAPRWREWLAPASLLLRTTEGTTVQCIARDRVQPVDTLSTWVREMREAAAVHARVLGVVQRMMQASSIAWCFAPPTQHVALVTHTSAASGETRVAVLAGVTSTTHVLAIIKGTSLVAHTFTGTAPPAATGVGGGGALATNNRLRTLEHTFRVGEPWVVLSVPVIVPRTGGARGGSSDASKALVEGWLADPEVLTQLQRLHARRGEHLPWSHYRGLPHQQRDDTCPALVRALVQRNGPLQHGFLPDTSVCIWSG